MIGGLDVIEYCKSNLAKASLNSAKQITAVCPWCGKYGSFYIDSKTGNYICFKCQNKGLHLVGVIAVLEQMSWREAKAFLLKQIIAFRRKETSKSLLEKIRALRPDGTYRSVEDELVDMPKPKEFIPVWKNGKWRYPKYLTGRRVDRETAKLWGLGYCAQGEYANRLIIPISCPLGQSFTARDMRGDQKPKYLNPPGVSHSRLLLGWDFVDAEKDVILVEGPLDAIMLGQHGLNALALLGKNLHKAQLRMLMSRFSLNTSFVVMLDPEEVLAPYGVATQLINVYKNVYIARLPKGVDPGSSTSTQASEASEQSQLYKGERTPALNHFLALSKKRLGIV